MNLTELKELDNKLITENQLEEIELLENVVAVENVGNSSQYAGATWLDIKLDNGESIDVFVKY